MNKRESILLRFFNATEKEKIELGWFSKYIANKKICIGKIEMCFQIRSSQGVMGRFGGGWNWKLGFQAGGRTIIISLLVAELTIRIKKEV